MALTSTDLDSIHLRKLATPGRKYYGDNEKVYLGNPNGSLKLLDEAFLTTFNKTVIIKEDNVQDAIETLSSDITNLEVKVDNNFITTTAAIEEAKCLSVAMALIL